MSSNIKNFCSKKNAKLLMSMSPDEMKKTKEVLKEVKENKEWEISFEKKGLFNAMYTLINLRMDSFTEIKWYTKSRDLLGSGKDGEVYRITNEKGETGAVKFFVDKKSSAKIEQEVMFASYAAAYGITPEILAYNSDLKRGRKFIAMRDGGVSLRKYRGEYTERIEREMFEKYSMLDKIGIVHNDSNSNNVMIKDGGVLIIDFGFSRWAKKKERDRNVGIGLKFLLNRTKFPTKVLNELLSSWNKEKRYI